MHKDDPLPMCPHCMSTAQVHIKYYSTSYRIFRCNICNGEWWATTREDHHYGYPNGPGLNIPILIVTK